MSLKNKYQNLIEAEFASFDKKDDIDLYVKTINETCAKIQSYSEASWLNSIDTGLAKYGYWILPDGKEIEVDDFQAHANIPIIHGMTGVDNAITVGGWIRVITNTEFVADYKTINSKQFRTLMEILKDHNSFEGYTRFTLGTDDGGKVFDDTREFVQAVRNDVNQTISSPVVGEGAAEEIYPVIAAAYWFDTLTNKIVDVDTTHNEFVKSNPKMFDYDPKERLDPITQAIENGWVRIGFYGNAAYIMANDKVTSRKALTAFLKNHKHIDRVDMEINNQYYSLEPDKAFRFLSGRLAVDPITETVFKENIKKAIEEVLAEQQSKKIKPNLYKNLTEQNKMISEGISNASALKTRSDLMKLARRYTDSGNVFAPSNFESYEDQDHMVLKVSVFDNDPNKLHEIKNHLCETLSGQGWNCKGDIYFKESIRVKFFEVKKCFRSGAYQNRETPHLGIAIKGPKKSIILQ